MKLITIWSYICKVYPWLTGFTFWIVSIIGVCQYFDWTPYAIVKKYKITPYIQQFAAQKVRLGLDTIAEVKRDEINSVNWEIYNDGNLIHSFKDLFPTIILPPQGGIYNIIATAKVGTDMYKSNILNIDVIQDKPIKVGIFDKSVVIDNNDLLPDGKRMAFAGKSPDYQLLSQNGEWIDLTHDSKGFITIDSGAAAMIYNGSILIRPKGIDDLTKYEKINIEKFPCGSVKVSPAEIKR